MAQKIYRTSVFLFFVFTILISYCSNPAEPKDKPVWLNAFISKKEAEHYEIAAIWKYEWKNETVYYVIASCCDNFNLLLDENGKKLCSPDGGFTGRGDGKCPNFIKERKNGKLIWERTNK